MMSITGAPTSQQSVVNAVPTIYNAIVDTAAEKNASCDLGSSLRACVSGGAPLPG